MASEFQLIALIETLGQKTETLTGLLAEARQRISQLEVENKDQQNQLKQYQKKGIDSQSIFLKSTNFGKIVSDNLNDTVTSAEIKQKLDEYIQEIDRCIAHLSTLS